MLEHENITYQNMLSTKLKTNTDTHQQYSVLSNAFEHQHTIKPISGS